MATKADFATVFTQLKEILTPLAPPLTVVADEPENYSLNAAYSAQYKRDLFFGAVQIKKNYVSYHLMPIYIFPALLDNISPALKKRMQGKSCFNFTTMDEALLAELAQLTESGFAQYRKAELL